MEGGRDRRSRSFARIQYHYPNLRFDGSASASSSQNVSLSMWENLTSHEISGVFVFTYCHVDGSPIWDGSSMMPGSAVTSSCHLRDISRGKHLAEWKPVKYGIFTWMFGVVLRAPVLRGYLGILRVIFTTQRSQMWPLCCRPARHSRSNPPGTRATVLVLRIIGSLFKAASCLYGLRQLDP